MNENGGSEIWTAVSAGRHVLVRGQAPTAPADWSVVEIRCDDPLTTTGPLEAARSRVEAMLRGTARAVGRPSRKASARAPRSRASRRVLGEDAPPAAEAAFVEACNRLARESTHPSALLLRALDRSDEATVRALVHILEQPEWLVLPVVAHVGAADALPELERAVRAAGGTVVTSTASEAVSESQPAAWDWRAIPPASLEVLRAGAAIGPLFEVGLLARLLELPVHTVLARLQEAADLGAPLIDRGEGQLSLPESVVAALRASMLPSLLAAWHERIAELLLTARTDVPSAAPAAESPSRESAPGAAAPQRPAAMDVLPITGPEDAYVDMFSAPSAPAAPPHAEAAAAPRRSLPDARWSAAAPPAPESQDEARAAAHLAAGGRVEAAVESYLAAARRLSDEGDPRRARWMVEQATTLLEQIPARTTQALLRSRAHLLQARIQWYGSGSSGEFHLQDAMHSVEAARRTLPEEVPPALVAELATLYAGIAYDLGDLPALQGALEELTAASRMLLAAGEALEAARLLNDQAAINLRLGDPLQAVNLLTRSRQLFEQVHEGAPDDPMGLEELAATDHLLARVPLHAALRPGREEEAISRAFDHARNAESLFENLGRRRELGRLWETMARLELARGNTGAAAEQLSRAIEVQQALGDATGLARSAAAYCDLLVATKRPADALSPLADSIALNYEKGSRIGLAFNRRALETLKSALTASSPSTHATVQALEQRVTNAERLLGRAALPEPALR